MTTVRRLRPVLAAALIVCAAAPYVARAGAPTGDDLLACAKQVSKAAGGWAKISSPPYASGDGPTTIATFAVPSLTPKRIYVTNGQTVQASTTAGCKWDHIYPAPPAADTPNVSTRQIAQLVAPTPTSLWISSYDSDGGIPRPHIEVSADATPVTATAPSKAFNPVEHGLPPVGKPVTLGVSKLKADRAFVLIEGVANPLAPDSAGGPDRTLYRLTVNSNTDKAGLGLQWEAAPGVPSDFGHIDGMTMNTSDMFGVWIWSGSKYAFSRDSGTSFEVFSAPGPVTAIDLTDRDAAFVTYSVAGHGRAIEQIRDENGKYHLNRDIPLPVVAGSVTHGENGGVYAVAGERGTYGFDVRLRKWASIHPAGVSPFVRIAMGKSATGRILLGQAAGALYRFDLYTSESFLPPPPGFKGTGDYGDIDPDNLHHPTLKVAKHEVTVAPGGDVPDLVDLGINPDPSPLDVYFLLDTTTSMQSSIDGLKYGMQHIAHEITRKTAGQACFGVGEFKDDGLATVGGGATIAYQRDLAITCEDAGLPQLTAALNKIHESGGGGPQYEGATLGLHEAVKGDAWPNPPVLPNQEAGFRGGDTTRVIVLITDAGFMKTSNFPTIEQTIKDLNGNRVNVVGIVVRDRNTFTDAWDDVTQVVSGTDTRAPENGVDCNEDGKVELAPGMPLVCEADGQSPKIGAAIVGLLLGVKDMGTIGLNVGDPYHVVKKVEGTLSAVRNLKLENHLQPNLHLTCAADQDGMDLPVRLLGTRRGTGLLGDKIVVHCRAPKVVVIPPPPPREPEPDPLPLPRPQLAPVLLPQFQPPPVNNPISNINPNAGFSQQEEQQLQLAAVGQDAEQQQQDEEEVELAMSAVHENDAAAAGLVLGCAMFVGLAGAVGVAHRRRTQRATRTAYARVR